MKRLVAAGLVALALSHPAQAYFLDGNKLVEKMRQYEKDERGDKDADYVQSMAFMMYVVGVHDAFDGGVVCTPASVTVGQASSIVAKYLNAHPEEWNEDASMLVVRALSKPFPCPVRRK